MEVVSSITNAITLVSRLKKIGETRRLNIISKVITNGPSRKRVAMMSVPPAVAGGSASE
jgi:hypothetical protein